MEIPQSYEGREHSLIKHELLKGYLEKLLLIKGMTGTRDITYVDCFAGPYGDETPDIKATSISISLDILNKVRGILVSQGKDISLRAIYVEKKRSSYDRLKVYLDSNCPENIQAFQIYGEYAEKADEILQLCGDRNFTFFFVDPLGWTDVGIPQLGKLLKRPKSEFLITFMYDHLNRFVEKKDLREQVSAMLGQLDEDDFQNISTLVPGEREEIIVRKYREQIMVAMGPDGESRSRSYSTVIKDKDKERTKYHLVYGTRHPKGIIEFAKVSEKAEFIQRVVRIQVRQNADQNLQLFSPEQEADRFEGVGIGLEKVKNYWLGKLSDKPTIFDDAKLADMLEETGWLIGDLQLAFGELLSEKKVENLSAKKKRTTQHVHFDNGELLRRRT